MLVIVNVVEEVFFTITDLDALVVPTATFPNASIAGVSVTGRIPVPLSGTD